MRNVKRRLWVCVSAKSYAIGFKPTQFPHELINRSNPQKETTAYRVEATIDDDREAEIRRKAAPIRWNAFCEN
jgi:hypothetical protein